MFKELEKENFEELVINESKLVIVDFYANWCAPCMKLKPILHELGESRDDIKVIAVNVDENDELGAKFKVYSIPAVFFIQNGKVVDNFVGFKSRPAIEETIKKHS
ncbi:MAG: thioredoxin [Bacilli bacterium]